MDVGILAVVELKRSAVGTSAELQALRYAACSSTMSSTDLSDPSAEFSSRERDTQMTSVEAEARIRAFVSDPDFEAVRMNALVLLPDDHGEGSGSSGAERARGESAGISPEVAVRLQRLACERVTNPMCR